MNEEIANRLLRTLVIMVPILAILLAFVITFAFPRGIRITLGRRSLWLAPPAVPIYSYFRIAAQFRKANVERAAITAHMRDMNSRLDAQIAEITVGFAELTTPAELEVSRDLSAEIVVAVIVGIENVSRIHFEEFQKSAATIDALLAQPAPRTIPDLFQQEYQLSMNIRQALLATKLRTDSFQEGLLISKSVIRRSIQQSQRMTELTATIDEIGAALRSLGDQVDDLGDQVELTAQPGRGRPPKRVWSDDEIRGLHAAYLVRDEQTATQFAKRNHLTESQMFKLFRRVGITKKGPGNYDSEF